MTPLTKLTPVLELVWHFTLLPTRCQLHLGQWPWIRFTNNEASNLVRLEPRTHPYIDGILCKRSVPLIALPLYICKSIYCPLISMYLIVLCLPVKHPRSVGCISITSKPFRAAGLEQEKSSNVGKSLMNDHIRNQHKDWSQRRGFPRNVSDADVISLRSGGVVNMLSCR